MKTPIQLSGYWNFSSNVNDIFAGNLMVGIDILLTLLGCHTAPQEPFLVHGTTTDGKKITLAGCYIATRNVSMPGIPQIKISADQYFNGAHLASNSFQFKKAIITFSDLHHWIDIGGFEKVKNEDEDGFYYAKYKTPVPISFFKSEGAEYFFTFSGLIPWGVPRHKLEINQNTLFEVNHEENFDLETFWTFLSQVKSFLTIAYFSEPGVRQIKLVHSETEIEFIFRGQFEDKIKEKNSKYDFLFLYRDLTESLPEIFKNWTNLYSAIGPVIDNLEESFRSRTMLVENKFLNIIQGIETFHRRTRNNEKVSSVIHKQKIAEILLLCPDQHKSWLKERLSFSNEPTLHERLHNLFSGIDEDLRNHLFKNWEKIIVDSKNSRNYYTHYDKSLEKKALKGADLHYLTHQLKIFLLIIVLREAGISDVQLKKIITDGSHRLFNHLIFKE